MSRVVLDCDKKDAKFKSINRDVFAEINDERLEDISKGSVKLPPSVKVLTLKNGASLTDFDFLRNSLVFVIIVRSSGTFDKNEIRQLSDKIVKPMVLQIFNADSSRMFFTNTDKKFEEVEIAESHNSCKSNKFDFNFVCNLLHSEPEKFGKFSFEVAKMEMNTNACFKGKRLIDLAVAHGDLLVLKFLQLFRPDITAFNDDHERILEIAVENGNLELLKAILEIPIEAENFEAYMSSRKRNALNLISNKDMSLLMIAAGSGKTDVIRFLLKCGLDVNLQNNVADTAGDFGWHNGYIDAVVELLKSDGPFPYDFNVNYVAADSELAKISEERYNLHEQIKKKKFKEVRRFVEHHPNIKSAYDSRNQCALATALESKNFEICSFLRSKGYTHGCDEDYKKILAALTNEDKEKLKLSNRKYFPSNEIGHIMDLLSRSRLGFGSEQKYFGKVQKYFEALDAIPEVQPILKIISLAKKLDIVFDFNQESVADMDPTQNFINTVVAGRTIYNNGNILIGARSTDAEVLATMAHEFTHYAMHLLYGNEGLPYFDDDESRKQEFAKIVDSSSAMQSRNPVIGNVFMNNIYKQEEFAVELIVRVPQLLALHLKEPNKVELVRKDFGTLFKFFSKRILPACEQEIPVLKAKQTIRDLNQRLDVKTKAEATKLFCDKSKMNVDEIADNSKNTLMLSNVPDLVLHNVLKFFKKTSTRDVESSHIFIKLEQLLDPNFSDMIREAFDAVTEPKLIVLGPENEIHFADIKIFFNYPVMRSKVVLIVKSILTEKEDEENFNKVFPIQPQKIEYNWSDLSETSQAEVLTSKVQSKGQEICLSDVVTVESNILNELPLEEVFKLSGVILKTLNEAVPPSPDIYIERKFNDTSNLRADLLTTENVIELLILERSLILADDSGMGKTTSALHFTRELKKRHPYSWVVHIDLKKHTESYCKDDEFSSTVIASDFFSDKILNLKGSLETKVFEYFFETEKIIFIIDGFDEISPVYKNCILEVVKAIRKSKNLLLITTRTHLTTVLKESMPSRIIKLRQFTFDEQVKFLVKFWSRSNETLKQEFETKAITLLESFRKAVTQEDFFGVPLQVRMLAEIHEKSVPSQSEIRELNIFSLYHSFIKKKTEIWIERGPLAKEYNTNLQTSRSWNFTQIHEKLAIEKFFDKKIIEALELEDIKETLTDELLVSFGLLKLASGKLLFTHQSLSEYFAADFVLSNVAKKSLLARSEELHQMFLEILHDQKFLQVRLFINGKLEMKEKLNVDILSLKLEKSIIKESNRTFLLNLAKENLSALINFMLRTVNISKTCKVSLVNGREKYSDSALHIAAMSSSLSCFQTLWSCVESFTEEDERTRFLFSLGVNNWSVLHCAIFNDNHEVLKEILEIASNCMNSVSFKQFLMYEDHFKRHALIMAAKGHPIAFDLVWKAVEKKLEAKDQKDLLFSQDDELNNLLLAAVNQRSQEVIQLIWKITENLFEYEEMRKFLFAEDCYNNTALYKAIFWGDLEAFTILWSFIKNVLHRADQKILWEKKSEENSNIFIESIKCHSLPNNIAKEIISASEEIFDPDELRSALTEKNFRNDTFVSLAVRLNVANQIFEPQDFDWVASEYECHQKSILIAGNTEVNQIVQALRDALIVEIGAQELKHALYAVNEAGDTALQFAIVYGSSFLLERIFQLADMRFSTSERKELIQMIGSFTTSLNHSLMIKDDGPVDSCCKFLIRQSDLVSEVKALFLHTDPFGYHFFTWMAMFNRDCLFLVLGWFKKKCSHDDLLKIFFDLDKKFEILGETVASCCNEDFIKKFFDFCVSSFDMIEVKQIILFQNHGGFNMLGKSLFNETSAVVIEVWNFYVHILNDAEIEELLFKDKQGRVYFTTEEKKNLEAVENLKTIAIERYGKDKFRELFR